MSEPEAHEARDLLLRARAGDQDAFAALVERYQRRVYHLAYRLTYHAELASDITQDVFLRLYEHMDRYDAERPFEPWFFRLATNYALNARAKARRRRMLSLDASDDEDRGPPAVEDPDAATGVAAAGDAEERRAIRAAIQALPEKYAGIVVLFYLEGLQVKEIAERLDMPVGTVKIRLHRGRSVLREKLERLKPGS